MRMTKQDELNLARFGCTFKEKEGIFCINWKERSAAQASNAGIFAGLGHVQTNAGPIVLLAFEISAVRPLPSYCYFPFDLKEHAHRDYLSRFTETGEINLRFLTDTKACERVHRLTPYVRLRASETYAETLQEWESLEPDRYDFGSALQLLERHVRIPEFVDRLLLEDTLREVSEKIDEAIQAVPSENRELARSTARGASEVFLSYYRNNKKKFLEYLHLGHRGFTYLMDLHRMFADNPEGLTKFLGDALAASFSRQELGKINETVKLVESLSELPFNEQSSSATESIAAIPELPAGLVPLVQSMAASGISTQATSRFFELIGLKVGGKPGRPPKDYSREYEWKASGSTWSEVARRSLQENPELRSEFGGHDFDSLTFEQKEGLMNRIRQGVRSYAERASKPFPLG
jgi:hypothetical protein